MLCLWDLKGLVLLSVFDLFLESAFGVVCVDVVGFRFAELC